MVTTAAIVSLRHSVCGICLFLKIGKEIPHWPVALLLGIVLWNFFTEVTKQGLKSIVNSGGIIRKINFPKYVIVISTSLSALINLAINLCVVLVFAIINQVDFTWSMLLVFPYIVEIYFFAIGLAFLLGTINVKYRDIDYIWEIVIQAMFYGSAIIYPVTRVIDRGRHFAEALLLNPVAQAIQDARHFAVSGELPTLHTITDNIWIILTPYAVAVVVFALGAWYFRRRSPYFAEEV